MSQEKESLTHYIQSAHEARVPQVAERFFKTGKKKEEMQCWLLKEAPTSKCSRDPV